MGEGAFTFPTHMPREDAQQLLAEAYQEVDAGKVLRRALKRQREAGYDPPGDVQYVSEPRLEERPDGVGVRVASDILLYEEFPGMRACVDLFEEAMMEDLAHRLEKKLARWAKRHPPR